mmetsp:Transcript_2074/g.6139  ORF Transcript_2074/g.6139 Transcript_2074/m.6139 type:complete len:201 (+) Transcript_2074:3017-3619(+)
MQGRSSSCLGCRCTWPPSSGWMPAALLLCPSSPGPSTSPALTWAAGWVTRQFRSGVLTRRWCGRPCRASPPWGLPHVSSCWLPTKGRGIACSRRWCWSVRRWGWAGSRRRGWAATTRTWPLAGPASSTAAPTPAPASSASPASWAPGICWMQRTPGPRCTAWRLLCTPSATAASSPSAAPRSSSSESTITTSHTRSAPLL